MILSLSLQQIHRWRTRKEENVKIKMSIYTENYKLMQIKDPEQDTELLNI